MPMRRASRVDENQVAVVKALRKIGASVLHLHREGGGCPDLLAGYRGRNVLLEVKMPGEEPNELQVKFIKEWRGEVHVVHSPLEAVRALTRRRA